MNQNLGTWTNVRIKFKYFLRIHIYESHSTSVWASATCTPLILYRSLGERNTAVTTYFGEIVFFTKMETIFNNTDCDKLL